MTATVKILSVVAACSVVALANPVPAGADAWFLVDNAPSPHADLYGGSGHAHSEHGDYDAVGGGKKEVDYDEIHGSGKAASDDQGDWKSLDDMFSQVKVVLRDVSDVLDKVEKLDVDGIKNTIHRALGDLKPVVVTGAYMMDEVGGLPLPIPKEHLPEYKKSLLEMAKEFPDIEKSLTDTLNNPVIGTALRFGGGMIRGAANGMVSKAYRNAHNAHEFAYEDAVEDILGSLFAGLD